MNRLILGIIGATAIGALSPSVQAAVKKGLPGADRQKYEVIVDGEGVMRRSDTGEEVSYYGTNYTTPFAYSYRALGREGHDLKAEIDKDVYHMARMGINAFRLHLWDVELADSLGNVINNEHLDLLDYLIAQLENRGIDIVLTAQTNFGNGYPEKNIDTGAFTYDFDKCHIHDDAEAQKIQERYLKGLLTHKNPYTGRTLGDDKAIIAWEINNEPCHSGTKEEVTAYIDRMTRAMRKAGYKRPILYNVTHNPDVTEGYYAASDIQGTTYQWYPTGLVAGHQREGNFLPALDNYTIPWEKTMPGYDKRARVVYEFDPADVLYSHLYPAIARTFRGKGFQWITQFAYDPLEIAQYNTEYPTHFLNLVYTPAKALSMMIATQTALETPRGADYGKYPENRKFGHTTVSHDPDLSVYNAPELFIYTNDTDTEPIAITKLRRIAGHGSSPIVKYDGSGAYFLDATGQKGVWRLEMMPDITITEDPFGVTSVNDAKAIATFAEHPIRISLPDLGAEYAVYDFEGNQLSKAGENGVAVTPGTWIIAAADVIPDIDGLKNEVVAGNIGMTEYVAPAPARLPIGLLHAKKTDEQLDVNMIPEAWNFKFDRRNPSWDLPPYYKLEMSPKKDGTMVVRRRVGDKIEKVPVNVNPQSLKASFIMNDPEDGMAAMASLPEGSEIAVVTRDGYTYSAPLILNAEGSGEVRLSSLAPRTGYIMPAPYPVTVTRDVPAPDHAFTGWRDIEFVELIIPARSGSDSRILLKEIWLE